MSNNPSDPTVMISPDEWRAIGAALAAPFDPADVDWRVQGKANEGGRAQVVCFVDARAVQDRLDTVVGPGAWSFDWEPLVVDRGEVQVAKGTLTIYGVAKSDAGSASNFEATLGAVSHCFKRAAVQWGIGRYLYALPQQWVAVEKGGRIPAEALRDLRGKLPRPRPTSTRQQSAGTPAARQQEPTPAPVAQPDATQPATGQQQQPTQPTAQQEAARRDASLCSPQDQRDFVTMAHQRGLNDGLIAALLQGQLQVDGVRMLSALTSGAAQLPTAQLRKLLAALPDATPAPVPAATSVTDAHATQPAQVAQPAGDERLATPQQIAAIRNLSRRLDVADPAPDQMATPLTYTQAGGIIADLSAQYDRRRAEALAG